MWKFMAQIFAKTDVNTVGNQPIMKSFWCVLIFSIMCKTYQVEFLQEREKSIAASALHMQFPFEAQLQSPAEKLGLKETFQAPKSRTTPTPNTVT